MGCVDRALLSCRLRPFNASRCYHHYNDLCENFCLAVVDLSVHRNGSIRGTAYLICAHTCVPSRAYAVSIFAHCFEIFMSALSPTHKSSSRLQLYLI